jgi:hypothetical protein
MSPKTPSLKVSLAALGIVCMTTFSGVASAENPAPGSSPAQTSESVILLYKGAVLKGLLSEDDTGYILKQKLGTIRFPKRDVEQIFGSMQAVYQYKLSRLAERDPDEHMKLAKWCLGMKMDAEARTELQMVLALSPGHGEAKAMLANLQAAAERAARRDLDVLRTAASSDVAGRDKPEELNPADILPRADRSRGGSDVLGLPVIFDLAPAAAVKRAQDFARYVHPELQRHCAKCHNERYPGQFQLVQAKSGRDMSDDYVIRANLDATLTLVDPVNPSQSPLLTNSVMPHKPNNLPILPSMKARAYQNFSTWVNSLRTIQQPAAGGPVTLGAHDTGHGFASDRVNPALNLSVLPQSAAVLTPAQRAPRLPALPPLPETFPPSAGSPSTVPLDPRIVTNSYQGPYPGLIPQGSSNRPVEQSPGSQAQPSLAGTGVVGPNLGTAPTADEPAGQAPPKMRKKKEIDPSLIEKYLMNRNKN